MNIGIVLVMKSIEDEELKGLDLGVVRNNTSQSVQKVTVVGPKPGMRTVALKLRVIDVEPRKIKMSLRVKKRLLGKYR